MIGGRSRPRSNWDVADPDGIAGWKLRIASGPYSTTAGYHATFIVRAAVPTATAPYQAVRRLRRPGDHRPCRSAYPNFGLAPTS